MFDLDEFLARCQEALGTTQPILAVSDLVERAVADPDSMAAALPDRGVTVMLQDPDLTVLSVVVPGGLPLSTAVPHNHRMWAVVGVFGGQEDNRFFRRDTDTLADSGGRSLKVSDTLVMGADTIHSIHNPFEHSALAAIHVYGGDLLGVPRSMWTGSPYREEPYDDKKVLGKDGFRRPN